jgi:nicotinamide riboside transporter PnuC
MTSILAWLLVLCAIFGVLAITPPRKVQMMCRLLGLKVNLISFHTIYNMHHKTF